MDGSLWRKRRLAPDESFPAAVNFHAIQSRQTSFLLLLLLFFFFLLLLLLPSACSLILILFLFSSFSFSPLPDTKTTLCKAPRSSICSIPCSNYPISEI